MTQGKICVLVIGTLHSFHKGNPNYGYEDLFSLIDQFQADVIGVEIRPEDIDQPSDYLSRSYPYEMIESVRRYGKEKNVIGFDWLGHELDGRLIPDGYWQECSVKRLEREFELSPKHALAREILTICDQMRMEIIKAQPSAAELNDGRYDAISRIYYHQLGILTQGSQFEELSKFYDERDTRIAENVAKIVSAHPGKRLVFLMGIDHRSRTVRTLSQGAFPLNDLSMMPTRCEKK